MDTPLIPAQVGGGCEAENSGSPRPALSAYEVLGQPGLHGETLGLSREENERRLSITVPLWLLPWQLTPSSGSSGWKLAVDRVSRIIRAPQLQTLTVPTLDFPVQI